ncbi:hypothetical protein RN607_07685 [Demequina capsici]|uniref:DUF2142 domain-containing protein n=1 Tax=Demequina capsici TaxID=3075620 RepID=A0AA96J8D8_9MICO|nr:glycosyltransferase family 39 protein [Demequina sp. PMTSA13]WNM26082.1 hypothetical protein RN607_07685 [Demequina sp. PMTSA13]
MLDGPRPAVEGPRRSLWVETATAPDQERRRRVLAAVLYTLISAALVLTTLHVSGQTMSFVDEPTHVDYAWKVAHGEVPRQGSTLSPEILRLWACEGRNTYELPECGTTLDPADYPYRGENYNFGHPPTYYLLTGLTARAITEVAPAVGFMSAARALGIVWLAAGMWVLYVALRRWRVDPALALVAPALLPLFPRILHASTTVNPDALAPLAGAAALWAAALVIVEEDRRWWIPAVLAAVTTSVKVIMVVPFLALAVLLLIKAVRRADAPAIRRRFATAAVAILVAVLATYVVWQGIQAIRASGSWTNPVMGHNTEDVEGFPFSEWLPSMFGGLELASDYYVQYPLDIALLRGWTEVLNAIVIGAGFAVVVAFVDSSVKKSPGWLLLIGAVIYPVAVQVQTYLANTVPQYFPHVTGRYGLSLIPIAIGCIAMASAHAGYRRFVGLLIVAGWIVLAVDLGNAFHMPPLVVE